MKPAPFEYRSPRTLDEALDILAEEGEGARILAGGQSLVPAMNFRLAAPAVLVDLNRVPELSHIRESDGGLKDGTGGLAIGAMTRQREVERSPLVAARAPLLHETMPFIAHPQIRNRGTVGGSVAHADPAAEIPAVMVALGARFRASSRREPGGRWIDAGDFFTGFFATALAPDEILVEIETRPPRPGSGAAFCEIARRHGDYALVGVAAVVTLGADGRCEEARVVLLSVGDGPVSAPSVGRALDGESVTEAAIAAAAAAVLEDIDPPGDIHASAAYRRHLAEVLTRQTLARAADRGSLKED